jgi:hypothetical protein
MAAPDFGVFMNSFSCTVKMFKGLQSQRDAAEVGPDFNAVNNGNRSGI